MFDSKLVDLVSLVLTFNSDKCDFHDWSPWEECEPLGDANPCVDSTRSRSRSCPCGNCDGEMSETENCVPDFCEEATPAPTGGECVGEDCGPDNGGKLTSFYLNPTI